MWCTSEYEFCLVASSLGDCLVSISIRAMFHVPFLQNVLVWLLLTALLRDLSIPTNGYLFAVRITSWGDRRGGGILCEGVNEASRWVEIHVTAGLQSAMLLGACAKHLDQRDPPRSWMAGLATGVFLSILFWQTSNKLEARRHHLYVQVQMVSDVGRALRDSFFYFPAASNVIRTTWFA